MIKKLGGLTRTARALGNKIGARVPVTTVQGWNERDLIPQQHWLPMIKIAKSMGIHISAEDFIVDHDDPDADLEFSSQSEAVA